jgi:signal transduction histidine kinase
LKIHEHHPLLDARLVDEPKTGADNLTNAIATTAWLAAGMVHDFRNPLGTNRSASEILLDVDVDAAQLKRIARNMHHAATRMQELLTDLTDSLRGNLAPLEIGSLREIILAASNSENEGGSRTRQLTSCEIPRRCDAP